MRAVWKGSINFGLVSIPVKAYNATVPKEVRFTLLHSKDGGKIRYRKFCEKCKEDIPDEEIVKGYEIAKNEYVVLTEEELEKIPLKSIKSIDIKRFFDPAELREIYYSDFYYVVPDRGGERAYTLFKYAMRDTNLMGVGKIGMRGRERVVALKWFNEGILLVNLHYVDEIRNPKEIPNWGANFEISDEELELAKRLIMAMKKPLNLEEFKNEYKDALMKLIDAKLAGKEMIVAQDFPTVKSLMDALKESLEIIK
ncbi:MAG: Ku protein [Archaeoglobaceae archaeon]|nr:Ku protein [Archaeoglobaceae archaeon]MDW7989587.1 Ku protein [Archaeoglobaceae archaeon]